MSLLDRFDLIVFDFDGTLCDSLQVKTEAFHLLYLDERGPEFADRVRAYHLANAGVPRYDKIRYVETEMIGSEPSNERVEEMAARFGKIVEEQVIAAPLFDGVLDFLETLDLPVALASATPTEELRRIIDAKGIDRLFVAIDGSPRSKGDIVTEYVTRLASDPVRVLMVGDQPSDLAAATQAGTDFIAIVDPGEPHAWATPFPVVPDFPAFVTVAAGKRGSGAG
ncbi:MAG: HAD family hydrolase [Acidobacteria bacterium]|nr:HAD family hydrolase [Acidobacteriota bacterium]